MIHAGPISNFLTEQLTARCDLFTGAARGPLIAACVAAIALGILGGAATAGFHCEEISYLDERFVRSAVALNASSVVAAGFLFGAEGIIVGAYLSGLGYVIGGTSNYVTNRIAAVLKIL